MSEDNINAKQEIDAKKEKTIKILMVTTNVRFYLKTQKLFRNKYTIHLSKTYGDTLSILTSEVFDLVIIHNIFELIVSVSTKTNFSQDIDLMFEKFREYIHYKPAVILLFDDVISKIRAKSSNLEEVDNSLVLPVSEFTLMKLIDKTISSNKKETVSSSPTNIIIPKFIGVGLAISTGGPKTIYEVISEIPYDFEPPIFIVQHGPDWLLEDYVEKFHTRFSKSAMIAKNGQIIQPNTIYIAPDKFHTVVDKNGSTLQLIDTEKECFVKPSADPLFRSIAKAFGQFSIGIVMTGLGSDGTKGSLHIEAAGGKIFAEDPQTAIAPSMPRSLIKSGCNATVLKADMIGEAVIKSTKEITNKLKNIKKK